jgi:hypothetical protein
MPFPPLPFDRPLRRHWFAVASALLLTAGGSRALAAQQAPPASTWAQLEAAPGASPTQVAWLRQHVGAAEREELAALVGALSAPAAAQLMASYLHADGSVLVPFTGARAMADSLAQRPPEGNAGRLHVAYLAARLRASTLAGWSTLGVFAADFRRPSDAPAAQTVRPAAHVAAGPAVARPAGVTVALRFDFAPAESLLAIVGTPDIAPAEVMRRLDTPAFATLLAHRSQSFYRLPWTRESMALHLSRAASTLPVDRLYAYANPTGLLHYGDVRRHLPRYRALIAAMRAGERALLREVEAGLVPFLPAGTRMDRTVAVYFGDGADGWASGGVAAVDLEWFKDDWPRLRATLVHEAFHAAQSMVRRPAPRTADADSLLREAFEKLFREGTANYVAPARATTAAERAAGARAGAALLDSLVAATGPGGDPARARALVDRGVSGAGPFYLLGQAMSAAIVEAFGASALAATLPDGGIAFARRYRDAVGRRPGAAALLPPSVFAALDRLRV